MNRFLSSVGQGWVHSGLRCEHRKQFVPAVDEGLGALPLQLRSKCRNIHTGGGDLMQHPLGVAATGGEPRWHAAVVGVGPQRLLGHCVNGVRGGEVFDVEHVGSFGIFRAGAGEKQPLRAKAL